MTTCRRAAAVLIAALAAVALIAPVPAQDKSDSAGWVQLFNGKDLTGWRIHPQANNALTDITAVANADGKVIAYTGKEKKTGKEYKLWRVEDGTIIGGGPASHLFTERDDYKDFHFRVEAKVNDGGNSGQYFRTEFGPGFPKGYEAQLNATHRDPIKTGSLYPNPGFGMKPYADKITVMNTAPHKPDEFFTQEVIAVGPKITILVNGKQTIEWTDPDHRFKSGCFALQAHDPGSIMTFRKVEVKEIK